MSRSKLRRLKRDGFSFKSHTRTGCKAKQTILTGYTGIDLNSDPSILRTVRKDNTIIYDSNRYSVPLGTYNTNPEVQLEIADGNLKILTVFGDFLCEHRISTGSCSSYLPFRQTIA